MVSFDCSLLISLCDHHPRHSLLTTSNSGFLFNPISCHIGFYPSYLLKKPIKASFKAKPTALGYIARYIYWKVLIAKASGLLYPFLFPVLLVLCNEGYYGRLQTFQKLQMFEPEETLWSIFFTDERLIPREKGNCPRSPPQMVSED